MPLEAVSRGWSVVSCLSSPFACPVSLRPSSAATSVTNSIVTSLRSSGQEKKIAERIDLARYG